MGTAGFWRSWPMHRQVGDASFMDAWLPPQVGRNARLDQLHEVVDWERLAAVVGDIYAAPEGRPSYPPLLMVKVLLLQQWYQASDPEIEAALWDRLSFRRFVGLGLQAVPDHSTSRFRTALATHGLGERLFAAVTRSWTRPAGWSRRARCWTRRWWRRGAAPSMDAGPGAGSATDPEASWTAKVGAGKAHLGVDVRSGLIRRAVLTGESERKRGGGHVDQRGRAGGLRGQGLRVQGPAGAVAGAGHQRSDHAPLAQAPAGAALLAAAAQLYTVEHVFGIRLQRTWGWPVGVGPGGGAWAGRLPGPRMCRSRKGLHRERGRADVSSLPEGRVFGRCVNFGRGCVHSGFGRGCVQISERCVHFPGQCVQFSEQCVHLPAKCVQFSQ